MAGMLGDGGGDGGEDAAGSVAAQIMQRADRDVAFIIQLSGESHYLLRRHFEAFIEAELKTRGVVYGAHPLLRPLIEDQSRELLDFVLSGVSLRHRFGMQAFENFSGDPARLLRTDLWDSLRTHIEDARRHFLAGAGGLQRILAQMERPSPNPARPPGR